MLRVVPGEEDLHQFPQGLSLNGVYGLKLDPDGQYSFWKNALEVLTNECPRLSEGQWHYIKPSPEACARADEILDAFDRFWIKTTREPAAYRAAERAQEAAMKRAWETLSKAYGARARTLEGLIAKAKLAEEVEDDHEELGPELMKDLSARALIEVTEPGVSVSLPRLVP